MDYVANMSNEKTRTNDITARWTAAFFDRRWRLDATLGMHIEQFSNPPGFPRGGASELCRMGHDCGLAGTVQPSVAGQCAANLATGFQSLCGVWLPIGRVRRDGGHQCFRLAGQLKSTNIFHAAGLHEAQVRLRRRACSNMETRSGILGWTALARWCSRLGAINPTILCFGCPRGAGSQLNSLSICWKRPHQDAIQATTRQYNTGLFYRRATRRSPI